MMHISKIFDRYACVNDVCIYDAHMDDAYIHDSNLCMMLVHMIRVAWCIRYV